MSPQKKTQKHNPSYTANRSKDDSVSKAFSRKLSAEEILQEKDARDKRNNPSMVNHSLWVNSHNTRATVKSVQMRKNEEKSMMMVQNVQTPTKYKSKHTNLNGGTVIDHIEEEQVSSLVYLYLSSY